MMVILEAATAVAPEADSLDVDDNASQLQVMMPFVVAYVVPVTFIHRRLRMPWRRLRHEPTLLVTRCVLICSFLN